MLALRNAPNFETLVGYGYRLTHPTQTDRLYCLACSGKGLPFGSGKAGRGS